MLPGSIVGGVSAAGDDPAPWRCLRDGQVVALTKHGDEVVLEIEIPRVRRRWPGGGTTMRVKLTGCTELAFQPWDEPPIEDPGGIIGSAPDLVNAEVVDGVGALAPGMKVVCASGELMMRYAELRIELEDGTAVLLDQLAAFTHDMDSAWEPRGGRGGGAGAS